MNVLRKVTFDSLDGLISSKTGFIIWCLLGMLAERENHVSMYVHTYVQHPGRFVGHSLQIRIRV